MENIIEVKNMAKLFSNQTALKDLSFYVKKGETFGFLGPSGSGKTTTIKILTGQLAQTDGEAHVLGVTVTKLKEPAYRKKIGVLTDNSGLYGRLSVYDNLKLFCDLYDVPYSRIEEVLQMVNLQEAKKKIVSKLSKGMLQRVTLARAFLHRPELLFLDEPTSALDPVNTKHIYRGLESLKAQGTTIFLTTHDMYEAETLCDRVAFLNNGAIQLLGAPSDLRQTFADRTLTIVLTDGQEEVIEKGPNGAETLYKLMSANKVESIFSNEPTLGDIFVEVTGRNLA
ncbi:ABC transporter ATP-binding protein [Lederbergia galactosidilytica]|uniref:Bacitracin ABC transporter ATP-binding protein n=1 Tax=Lederbergia galactosidilytica TaxID=217031 RepID=A0A177ZI71_9BACI|nr:ABC transporter ATP-binding protein [Lederbergia galactosidilytica]KRG16562.1 bacitracin ABC transporter ATP-binding protein [Virgibacillus soli]MBP1914231.1 ABC-2 type transport system ATP-binding protein [Lederbergia galactosidilytica]OAK67646.1 bacitracin ABC transporter ATP-binding protein [Lederbergia galactosidilytica]